MRIVCVGECMVEMAPRDAAGGFGMAFAGDTANTAWYLRQLRPDWRIDYLTAVGTDAVSDRMLRFLEDAGIGTGHVARVADRTVGLYLIELEHGERSFAYWRGESAARRLADDQGALDCALEGADLVFLSGITLAILAPRGRAALLASLARAARSGTIVAFDPNLRPRLWEGGAVMCEAVTETARQARIVLPSHDDEAAAFGDAGPAKTLARYAGVETVVVKNGAGRILYRHQNQGGHHDPVAVAEVIDSTAAGDSFNAAFLAALLAGEGVAAAAGAGAALSAHVIKGRGALVQPLSRAGQPASTAR